MKAISIIQPWATLIVHGHKRIETRSWKTNHLGPLLIHASKTIPNASKDLCDEEPFKSYLAKTPTPTWSSLPRGCLLGIVELTAVLPCELLSDHEDLTPVEKTFGDFTSGRWCWILKNPSPLVVPFPLRGAVGLFEILDSIWHLALQGQNQP